MCRGTSRQPTSFIDRHLSRTNARRLSRRRCRVAARFLRSPLIAYAWATRFNRPLVLLELCRSGIAFLSHGSPRARVMPSQPS